MNRESLLLRYYALMKELGASTMLSKKIKAEKATIQETFVVFWQIKSTLENVSVKDISIPLFSPRDDKFSLRFISH